MSLTNTSRNILGAKTSNGFEESEESSAEHPLVKSIMSNLRAQAGTTDPLISSPSVEDTTTDDTLTGDETPDILLTLPKDKWPEWVLLRLSRFQEAVVEYSEACKRHRESVRSASEAEWQATIETNGILRAVPNEQEVYRWVLKNDKI